MLGFRVFIVAPLVSWLLATSETVERGLISCEGCFLCEGYFLSEGLCFAGFLCLFVLVKVLVGCSCLGSFRVSFILMGLLAALFCSSMAHVKKTAKLANGTDVADSASNAGVSFKFGLSRVTSSDLGDFAKWGWFLHDLARPSEGETIPDPHDDEVVVYKEFFVARLRFPPHPLVIGVLKHFNLKFHQLNPSSFVKLSIYVWGCKS